MKEDLRCTAQRRMASISYCLRSYRKKYTWRTQVNKENDITPVFLSGNITSKALLFTHRLLLLYVIISLRGTRVYVHISIFIMT